MPLLADIVLGSNAENRHAPTNIREENGQVNGLAGHIADAFLSALREHGFSAGKIRKIIIELRRKFPVIESFELAAKRRR
jgi:predicted metal-dependent phosphotriesterase family hydrolase